MKKILLSLLVFAAFQISAFAQNYSFSQTTTTYTDLVSPTVLTGNVVWDDSSFVIPIGFPFQFGGASNTNVEIDANGVLLFMGPTTAAAIVGFDADFVDRGTTTSVSPISYQLSGTAGSRIFKVQWKNVGFFDGVPADFANLQIWMYEGSNKIEVRFGTSALASPSTIFSPATGPASGLATSIDFLNQSLSGIFLQGNPAAATATTVTSTSSFPSLSATPANGTLYVYTVSALGLSKRENQVQISVYPNPVADVLQIEGLAANAGNVTIKIYDALGKVVLTEEKAAAAVIPVNVKDLTKGSYLMEITSGNSRISKQVIKL
jgi:hypothetical protein